MRDSAYTTAVTRIRANENNLLTSADLDRLLGAADVREVENALSDKGYGGVAAAKGDDMFTQEKQRAWALIREIVPDFGAFYPLLCKNDFHNLKAIVKGIVTGAEYETLLIEPTATPTRTLVAAVSERRFGLLPENMRAAAEAAYDALAHAGDGQWADVLIDRAYLDAVQAYGLQAKDGFVRDFCEHTVALADIRIAMRGAKTGKPLAFLEMALAPCKTLDRHTLLQAALDGVDAVAEYLSRTGYGAASEAMKKSAAELEKWCDGAMRQFGQRAKYEIFGVSPLYQYLLSKEAEIAAVKIIYTGKRAGLPEERIRSYLRAVV